MATLTWRNVDAPDFRTSLEGYNAFSRMLNDAFSGAKAGLAQFDDSQNKAANQAVIAAAMKERDPEAYQKALASGVFTQGVDPKRVSAETYSALNNQASSLLQQAAQKQNLDQSKYTFNQIKTTDERAPLIAQARAFAQRGDEAGLTKFNQDNPGLLAGLGYNTVRDFQTDLLNDVKGAVGIAGDRQNMVLRANADRRDDVRLGYEGRDQNRQDARLNMEQGRYNWEGEDRQVGIQADQGYAQIRESIDPSNPDTITNALYNGSLSKMDPRVRAAVYARIDREFPGYGTPAATASGGGTNGNPLATVNYEARGKGFGSVPASVTNLGQASQYADSINAAGVASSAMGPYQIVGNTRDATAKRLYGANWRSKPYNLQTEREIAGAVFDSTKGDPAALRKQWVSLSPAEAVRVSRMSKDQALNYIAQKESGASASALTPGGQGSPFDVATGAALRVGQDRQGKSNASELIDAALSKSTNPLDVVDELKTTPRLAGTSREFIRSRIEDIVRRGKGTITYGQAGIILRDAARENNDSWDVTNAMNGNSVRINKQGDRISGSYVTNEINRHLNGGVTSDATRENDVSTATATLSNAQAQATTATAAYQNALRLAATKPGVAAQLPMLKARMDAANAAVTRSAATVERIAQPRRDPTPPSGGFWNDLGNLFVVHRSSSPPK